MNTMIAWFSGTGNSLTVARDVATGLGGAVLQPIAHLVATDDVIPRCERLGIVFPVYSWGMPLVVRQYVERLHLVRVSKVFAIATCGGSAGATLQSLDTILRGQGTHLDAGFHVTMPGNCTWLAGGPRPDQRTRLIERADARVREIVARLQAGTPGVDRDFLVTRILSKVLYAGFCRGVHGSDKHFKVTHACTQCGLCQRVCPVGNIVLDAQQRPTWQHRCQMCMACLQFCPTEAIQFWRLTKGVRRYRHPRVAAADLCAQQTGGPEGVVTSTDANAKTPSH